ncbi:pseudouridine synthase [Syncephalastrum racemosum]|uniref:tRNA pseudouridine(55) synthase n=1 Tax=Syncephalastrum racemosum TaxID=13706 RepID=A0A1X2H491_SYNRA|nr:pseudouridine synthase [Syncephalastrum racemosum]
MLRHALNGTFAVYKPRGYTSRKVTDIVQRTLSEQLLARQGIQKKIKQRDMVKIGHGGTLDPIAEGVLVLGLGHGCKQLHGHLNSTKEYVVTAQFGSATTSFDIEGDITHTGPTDGLTRDILEETLSRFRGEISQIPPIYSALQMHGKRLYEYAREGQELPMAIQPRQVTIHQLEVESFDAAKAQSSWRVGSSKGCYMRSLVHDVGVVIGCYAHMIRLERTRQGSATSKTALAVLDANGQPCLDLPDVESAIIPVP